MVEHLSHAPVLQPTTRHIVYRNRTIYRIVLKGKTIYRIVHRTDMSRGNMARCIRQRDKPLPGAEQVAMTLKVHTEKESIPMLWGFGHGLWFLLPLLFLGRLFWIVILALLIWSLIRWFRHRQVPFYQFGMPSAQPSALDILRQRYARGEIDAATFDQMRERLEATNGPMQQH